MFSPICSSSGSQSTSGQLNSSGLPSRPLLLGANGASKASSITGVPERKNERDYVVEPTSGGRSPQLSPTTSLPVQGFGTKAEVIRSASPRRHLTAATDAAQQTSKTTSQNNAVQHGTMPSRPTAARAADTSEQKTTDTQSTRDALPFVLSAMSAETSSCHEWKNQPTVVYLEPPQQARYWWGKRYTAKPKVRMPGDGRQKEAISFAAPDVDEAAVVIGQVKFLGPLLRKGIMAGGSAGALYATDQAVRGWLSDHAAYPKLMSIAQSKYIADSQADQHNTKPHLLAVLRREARDRQISLVANTVLAPGSLFMGINLLASAELVGGIFPSLVPFSELAMLPAVVCMAAYGLLVALKSAIDMAYGIRALRAVAVHRRSGRLDSMKMALPLVRNNHKKRIKLDAGLMVCGLMQAAGAAGMFLLGPVWLAVLLPGTLGLGLIKWYRTAVAGEWPVSSEITHLETLDNIKLTPTTFKNAVLATKLNQRDQTSLQHAASTANQRAGGIFARLWSRISPWHVFPAGQTSAAAQTLVHELAESRLELTDNLRPVFRFDSDLSAINQSEPWETLKASIPAEISDKQRTSNLVTAIDGLGLLEPLVESLIQTSPFAEMLLRGPQKAWAIDNFHAVEIRPDDILAAVHPGDSSSEDPAVSQQRSDKFAHLALEVIAERLGSTLLQQQALYADLLLSYASAPSPKRAQRS